MQIVADSRHRQRGLLATKKIIYIPPPPPRGEGEGERLSVVMMYIYLCTFFQGTDATVGESFAPLGPPLLPWENRMGRGQTRRRTDIATTRPNRSSGPIRSNFYQETSGVWFMSR